MIRLVRAGKKYKIKRDKHNPEFPLKRTVLCYSCNKPLTGSTSRGNGGNYLYYHCYNKQCPMFGKGIARDTLHKEFAKHLKKITPKQTFLVVFKETVLDLWREKGKSFELEGQKWERQLSILQEKRKRIFEMREDGSYSKGEFQERKEQIENEVAAAKISLSESRIEQFDLEGALAYATNFIDNLGRQWFDLPTQIRSKFQKLVFPEGITYQRDKGFGTAKLGVIYDINRQFVGNKSLIVDRAGFEPATSSLQMRRSSQLS